MLWMELVGGNTVGSDCLESYRRGASGLVTRLRAERGLVVVCYGSGRCIRVRHADMHEHTHTHAARDASRSPRCVPGPTRSEVPRGTTEVKKNPFTFSHIHTEH